MRLNLFISKAGVASRRKADILIKDGKVAVNAKV
ncbi:MAG: pseudouridine synthase, partial [Candidatus Omnitrophica bacterium]|nr:pseudouridine synthase [Candidatus Omnitrophota bacterium]